MLRISETSAISRRRRLAFGPLLSVFGLLMLCLGSNASAQTTETRVTIDTLAPDAPVATDIGPIPASQRLSLTLTFAQTPERAAALDQFLSDLTTSGSPNFRKWITPAQYAASYGATSDQIAAATAWAQAQGLTVDSIAPSGARMAVSGFPAQVEAAFAVRVHQVQIGGQTFFANLAQPSLPVSTAALFTSIQGLDNLPTDSARLTGATKPGTLINGSPAALSIPTLASLIEANATPILTLDATHGAGTPSVSQIAGYAALFRQAAAQGMTTLLTRTASSGGFPSGLPEVTAIANPGDVADLTAPIAARPAWQVAPGLPADKLRHAPDLTASSASALASTMASIAATVTGKRLGNINPALYQVATDPGVYTQPDSAPDGVWEPATGLGLVDLYQLYKVFPRGTGSTPSDTSISLSSYSVTYGTPITFTSNVSSTSGAPTPTGSVTFTLYGAGGAATVLGTVPLVANSSLQYTATATYTSTPLQIPAGSPTVQATYVNDSVYASSQSAAPSFYVAPETSVLSATVSSSNTIGGNFTVVVTDTGNKSVDVPTGTVTVQISGTSLTYTQPLVQSGASNSATASFTIPANAVGTETLAINCMSATSNFTCYNPLTPAPTVTIVKATPTLTFAYSPTTPVSGGSIALTAHVSTVGTAPVPTGSVTFYDGTTVLNAGNVDSSGNVATTGTVPTASTHTITATYSGDADYNSVTSNGATTGGSTTGTLTAALSAASGTPGSTVNVTGTVSLTGSTTAPTGSILVTINGTTSSYTGTLTAGAGATSSFSIPVTVPSTAGAYQITVSCAAADTFTCNTVSLGLASSAASGAVATSTIVTSTSYAFASGTQFTLTALVTPSSIVNNTAPTGTFTFTLSDGTVLGTAAVGTNGKGSLLVTTALNPGTYNFVASYSGDGNYAGSSGSSASTVTVTGATGVTGTLSAYANPTTVGTGASTTIVATVTIPGASYAPTGTITVTVPGVTGAVYTGTLIATGTNTASVNIAVPAPPAGVYQLQVACTTTNVTCAAQTVTLTSTSSTTASLIGTSTAITFSPAAPTAGAAVTLTATITPATTGSAAVSGTVYFYNGSKLIGQGTVTNGVATLTTTFTGSSSPSITATYSGDTNYAGSSTTKAVTIPLGLLTAGIIISSSGSGGIAGANVTITAVVNAPPGSTVSPTGSVSFYLEGGTTPALLGTATLSSTSPGLSTASIVTANIPAGTQTVYAVYSGDATFSTVESAAITVGATDYSVSFTPPSITLMQGQTGTVTLQVNTSGGFTGNIAIGCSPPPNAEITCSLSSASLNGAGVDTLSIFTVAPKLKARNDATDLKVAGGVSLAALLCFLLPGRNRRRLPGLLLVLLAIGLTANLGCSTSISLPSGTSGGTPLGTVNLTINTAGSNGTGSVYHDYTYQVTIIQ